MAIPECPLHGPMIKGEITQGDVILGYLWICVNDDRESPDYCDECADCDEPMPDRPAEQLSLFEVEI